jgi:hypothetical protein
MMYFRIEKFLSFSGSEVGRETTREAYFPSSRQCDDVMMAFQ